MKTRKQLIDFEHKGNEKHHFKLRPALLSLCMLTFIGGYSQTGQVNLNLKNATVKELFREIEKQTSYRFSYRDIEINKKGGITISGQGKELKEVLTNELAKQELTYVVSGNKIIVSPAKKESVSAKNKEVTGKVIDAKGEPVIGATIMEKGTTNGTITDFDGNFTLNVSDNSVIEVSYIGYKSLSVKANSNNLMAITLKEDTELLDEVVVVGYGTQRKGNLTGSVASVKSEQINIAPVSNVTQTLAGQLPGLVTKQTSGAPGSDMVSLNIRGFGNALIIVDGVEGSIDNLDPSQIENISILKDASASIYGARAGNGVILITTKRGLDGKPNITVNSSITLQGVTNMLEPMSSGEYATIKRESYINGHGSDEGAPFTEEEIQKYFDGSDPNYPNTNWYNHVFRNFAPQQNHQVSVRGGSEKIKYFGALGYVKQETMVKKNGGNYQRYNLQSNMDAQITKRLNMSADFSMIYENGKYPNTGFQNGSYLWQCLYETLARYPYTLPDPSYPSYGGNNMGSVAIASNTDNGYQISKDKTTSASVTLNYDFKFVKGLKAKAFINYKEYDIYGKQFNKQIETFTYNHNTGEYISAGYTNGETKLTESYTNAKTLTQQYSLSYDNLFADKHKLSGLFLLEMIDYSSNFFNASRGEFLTTAIDQLFGGSSETATNNGYANEMGRASFIWRLNYAYKNKYLLETILRIDGSAKFPKNSRWGYFPGVSLGWVMSEEEFLNDIDIIDNIKIRASYGETGNDNVGDFKYISGYKLNGSTLLNDQAYKQLISTGLSNPKLTWEKIKMYNAGIDFSLFNRRIYGTLEGFKRTRSGIPATRHISLPSSFGAEMPMENLNILSDRGFEFSIGSSGDWGKLKYDLSANISWSRAKWDFYDEPTYDDPVQKFLNKKTGNWTDQNFGYKSDGLFTTQEEIDNLDFIYKDLNGNETLRPGDIKYVDINNDGVLDDADKIYLGPGDTPHWMYGLTGLFKYRNWDLNILFQGAFGYNYYLDINGKYTSAAYNLRWTEEVNDKNSLLPRPGGAASNSWGSDYYMKNVKYLRLKSLQIGYNIPKNILQNINVESAKIYLAGTNLLTFSNLSKYGLDPEVPGGVGGAYYYPQQRTFSIGVNISF